jgi:hypothetical protein
VANLGSSKADVAEAALFLLGRLAHPIEMPVQIKAIMIEPDVLAARLELTFTINRRSMKFFMTRQGGSCSSFLTR